MPALPATREQAGAPPDGCAPDGGAPVGGAPDGGAPENGAPENGTPDSGAPDSGAPDNGAPDGGAPESGAAGASAPDIAPVTGVRGALDGNAPDNGALDEGAPDNGAPDNGAPDSGAPDSGAPDSGAEVSSVPGSAHATGVTPIVVATKETTPGANTAGVTTCAALAEATSEDGPPASDPAGRGRGAVGRPKLRLRPVTTVPFRRRRPAITPPMTPRTDRVTRRPWPLFFLTPGDLLKPVLEADAQRFMSTAVAG